MKKINQLALLFAALLAAWPAWAETVNRQAGTSGAQFLKLGAGARAGAMGDSFSAMADDASAAYYNPAGLYQLTGSQILGAHTAYFQGMNYEVMQFAYPFGRQEKFSRHTFALGVYYLSVDRIERRVSDTTDPLGTFGAGDGAYSLSYAYAVSRQLGLGVTAKLISQSLDTYHASAFAADAGALYKLNPDGAMPLSLAFVLRNAGSRPRFAGRESDPLPTSQTVGLGLQVIPGRLNLNVEGTKYRDTGTHGALGVEYLHPFTDNVSGAFRAGYNSQHNNISGINGLTLGTGINFYKATFDFAWLPFGNLGNTFRYSLLIKF